MKFTSENTFKDEINCLRGSTKAAFAFNSHLANPRNVYFPHYSTNACYYAWTWMLYTKRFTMQESRVLYRRDFVSYLLISVCIYVINYFVFSEMEIDSSILLCSNEDFCYQNHSSLLSLKIWSQETFDLYFSCLSNYLKFPCDDESFSRLEIKITIFLYTDNNVCSSLFFFSAGIGESKSTKLERNPNSTSCDNHCSRSHHNIRGKWTS